MISLNGRIAAITGGSRGIGAATARLFASAGADVVISYLLNHKAAQAVLADIEKAGRQGLAVAGELSREKDAAAFIDAAVSKFGRIDILVNNHGIWTDGPIDTMTPDVWDETMAVNLRAVFLVTQQAVRRMKKSGGGNIILVSSTAGQRGEAFHSHYAASKGAVIALTKSLAPELAPHNINVNCVAPGWVDTDMCAEVFSDPEFKESVRRSIPIGRIPPPEDIAGPILFLASDLARHITGEVLNVNGGSVLCG
jgi:3-oxoacyl-[acyl-carrier protein] reductase